jgi:hypothetical protein
MYLGRYQLGDTVNVLLLCRDANRTPGMPDDVPEMKVWDQSGNLLLAASMPIMDQYIKPGLFYYQLLLDGKYSPGNWSLTFYWAMNSGAYSGIESSQFEIVPGGDPDGAVIGMFFYYRPHANFVMQQLERGKVIQKRNPTF